MNYYKRTVFWLTLIFINLNLVGQTVIWSAEAETGDLLGSAIIKQGCSFASGGEFVQIGNSKENGIRFSSVKVPVDGDYQLCIYYFNGADLQLDVRFNGEQVGPVFFPLANWCYQGNAGLIQIPVSLTQGIHTIELFVYNNTAAPLIDKVVLKSDVSIFVEPTNYYISSSSGDDSHSGLSAEKAWRSLSKISSHLLYPGDSVFFKAGDTFAGQLDITSSGAKDNVIYFGRYGDGDKPILDGAHAEGGSELTSILINNQEYIEIADLEITNDRFQSKSGVANELAYAIYVLNNGDNSMHHFHFHNLTIRDVFSLSTEEQEFNAIKVAGIGFYATINTTAGKEKHIRDVIVEDCYIANTTRYGIHTGHGGGSDGIGNDSINRNMNMVFRNNHFYQTGGTCIMPGRVYNCLLENNIFDYPGSNADPRMVNRGSGAWFWSSRHVVSQYNKSYHVRGDGDSYGQHIDFGNENVILQYNYSEDSEGGFAEILGKNVNSVYRFNVSVNDGFRNNKGNSLWVSDYAGTNNKVLSDSNYIYNNTIYVDADITPDISIVGKNTFVYNNIFHAMGNAKIGEQVTVQIAPGHELKMSNNLYFGNVSNVFSNYDLNPVFGDPAFVSPGELGAQAYRLGQKSAALKGGLVFPEPEFPMAGKGIFKDVNLTPQLDMYGNPVNVSNTIPNIGAFNGEAINNVGINDFEILEPGSFLIYPNPLSDIGYVQFVANKSGQAVLYISDLQDRILYEKRYPVNRGDNLWQVKIPPGLRNGMYILSVEENGFFISRRVVLVR